MIVQESPEDNSGFSGRGPSNVDVLISPEHLISQYIQRLIEHPGALQVLDFADGKIKLLAMRADKDGPLIGKRLQDISELTPEAEAHVVAVYRDDDSKTGRTARRIRLPRAKARELCNPHK